MPLITPLNLSIEFGNTLCGLCLVENRASFARVSEFHRALRYCGIILQINRSTFWTKPSNCDADLSLLDAGVNRLGQSHPPRSTTVRDDWWIVRMGVMDHTATSQTKAQQIQSVWYHSMSARTIRRRLQHSAMSGRRPLLRLPLTGNHKRLRCQWCYEQRT
ncbi:transposable element Tcb1 transposase [Trichonephila clavipes]|nr:transposable element Tcb1 transposase [Trichonephila clavipes]